MAQVNVDTDVLKAGGKYAQDKYDSSEGDYVVVSGIDTGGVQSLESFKSALSKKNKTFEEHTNILNSTITECAANLETIDTEIGNNVTTLLSSVDNLDFSNGLLEITSDELMLSDVIDEINDLGLFNSDNYATSYEFLTKLHYYLSLKLGLIGSKSLYDVSSITPEQMKAELAKIKSNPGRDAVARAVMLIIGTAADSGFKLNYRHAGTAKDPHVSTSVITNGGVDCNAFVSWVLDKAVPGGLYWRSVEGFNGIGTKISDYSTAKCGDIFVSVNGNRKHVGVIIENNPAEGYYITAEARGTEAGICFVKRTYKSLQETPGMQVRDLSNVYNGTEDPNADRYAEFPNADNYADTW